MKEAVFYISAVVAVVSALITVTRRNPIYSALWLMISFVAIAVIFLELHAPFLAAMHLLLYTGAILVLFLFVIMLLNLKKEELEFDYPRVGRIMIGGFCLILGVVLTWFFVTQFDDPTLPEEVAETFGGASAVGNTIFGEPGGPHFILPFELVSVLIISAMIGAIMLARPGKRGGASP